MGWCPLLFAKQTARCKTGVVRYHCALPKKCTKKPLIDGVLGDTRDWKNRPMRSRKKPAKKIRKMIFYDEISQVARMVREQTANLRFIGSSPILDSIKNGSNPDG